jgi:hypothetical protein
MAPSQNGSGNPLYEWSRTHNMLKHLVCTVFCRATSNVDRSTFVNIVAFLVKVRTRVLTYARPQFTG